MRSQNDRILVANITDVRPEAPKVKPASAGGIDLIAALKKRPVLALAILVLSLLAGAPYFLRKAPGIYHAEASIYVSPTYFKNLQQDREQLQVSYTTLVNQQILTLRRYDILHEALMRLERQGIKWRHAGESEEAAVARLTTELDVQHIPDSYDVLVGLDSPEREWVAPIVNTVANTYLEKGKADDLADRSSRISALTMEQNNLQTQLQEKLEQQARLSQDLMMVSLEKATPVDDTILASARQAQEDATHKRMEAEAQLAIMQGKGTNGKNPLTSAAEEAVFNDGNIHNTLNTLIQRRSELQTKIQGLTPQHPLRQASEKELAAINEQIKHLPDGLADETSERMLTKLHADVDRNRLVESELGREVMIYASRVESRARQVQKAQGLSGDIDRLRRDLSAVTTRLSEMNLGENDPSNYLRMFSAAQPPIEPKKANAKKMLAVLFGLALFLAIAIPLALDLIDQRIVSPAEVNRAIGFQPVGVILEPNVKTKAFAEEHFRRLVNGIQRGMAGQAAKCVAITRLNHAGNSHYLVNEIGKALQERGLKTVIVDANPSTMPSALTPDDTLGGMEAPEVMTANGQARIPARLDAGPEKELSRISVGAGVGSLLDEMRIEYDVVLVDAPPLMLSADAEYLASVSDITLVVIETGKTTRRDLIEGATLLGRIGAPSIGVIMNQVRLRRAGGALMRDFKQFSKLSPFQRSPKVLSGHAA
jgi:uncharacterized protein involved in exopolysaccharide biosynthesis